MSRSTPQCHDRLTLSGDEPRFRLVMSAVDTVPSSTRPRFKAFGLGMLLVLLAAVSGYAGLREWRKTVVVTTTPSHADVHAFADRRPAQSAAEERFSQALWNIHADVRTAAVRMTFAGLTYKIGDADVASVSTKVAPLTAVFDQAEKDLLALDTPASMQDLRIRYAEALRGYREASLEMVKVSQDGKDAHLLKAQEISERASGVLLQVGEQLWPGEIKPN
jgi:hypothetical protein